MNDLLIIDDDVAFASVLARSLTRRGYQVRHAANPEAALVDVAAEAPSQIILDLNLAGESGLRLLPQLLARAPQARILVLTGYASIATAVEAVKLGAVNYLAKPAGVDDILSALGQVAANPEQDVTAQPMSLSAGSTCNVCWPSTTVMCRPPPAPSICTAVPCSACWPSGR